jgi:hypothetical protein
MILYIYIGISLLTLVVFLLTNASLIHDVKQKLKDLPEKNNKDMAGLINAYLKLAIISFIPLVNVCMLFILLFCGNEINKRANKLVDEAIEKR